MELLHELCPATINHLPAMEACHHQLTGQWAVLPGHCGVGNAHYASGYAR